MKNLNFFTPKERNNYLLEVENTTVAKSVAKPRLKGGQGVFKKIASGFVVATIMALALVGGLVATSGDTTNSNKSAVAADDPNLFNWPSLFCLMKDDDMAYLGGSNSVLKSGWNNEKGANPNEGLLAITSGPKDDNGDPTETWTALEQYGYFAPSYSTWQGAYIEKNDGNNWPFIGSGGYGENNKYGKQVTVLNAGESPMFSHDWTACGGIPESISSSIANAISFLPKMFIAVSSEIYGYSSTVTLTDPNSPLKPIADGISNMILGTDGQKGLKDVLFLDFLTPLVLVATIGLIWTGIVKRSSLQAGQAALWMIGASVAGLIFLSNPLLVPKVVDDIVGKVNASVSDAFISGDNSSELCDVEGGTNATIRQMKCVIWYSTIYVPWVSGQFSIDQYSIDKSPQMLDDENTKSNVTGDEVATPGGDLPGEGFKDPVTPEPGDGQNTRHVFERAGIKFGTKEIPEDQITWALYQMDRQHNAHIDNKGIDYSEIAYNQLVVNKNADWKGAANAMGASWLSFIGAIGPGAVLISIGFTLIAYQVTMLVLMAFSPLLFLVGVAPGWGRRVAMRWLELIVGLLVKRIILMMFLLLFIKMYSLIIAQTGLGWFFQAVMIAVLSAVAITQRAKIMSLFTDAINFGGDRRFGDDGSTSQLLKDKSLQTALAANAMGRMAVKGVPTAGKKVAEASRTVGAGTKTAAKGTAKAASATVGVVGEKAKSAARNVVMEKGGGDQRLGLGENGVDALAAHKNLSTANIDKARLTEAERASISTTNANGETRINRQKAKEFITKKKAENVQKSDEIKQAYKDIEARKVANKEAAARKKTMSPQELAAYKEEKKRISVDREKTRAEQANLNREVYRLFGAPKDAKGSTAPQYNREGIKGAPVKIARNIAPSSLNTKYVPSAKARKADK